MMITYSVEDLVKLVEAVAKESAGNITDMEATVEGKHDNLTIENSPERLRKRVQMFADDIDATTDEEHLKEFCNQLYFMNQHNVQEKGGICNNVYSVNSQTNSITRLANIDLTKCLFSTIDLLLCQPQSP